jgi:FMN phosphatase YigB (HAD superfamily)
MRFDCIILDFDGTFTDVEKEAVPFLEAYRDDLAESLGADAIAGWDEAAASIGADPDSYGWEFDGRIVAPSHADPYIMATSTAQKLLDEHGLLPDAEERRSFLEELFRRNYPKAANVFRPDARQVVEELLATGLPIYVVTNSLTDAVEAKLDDLAPKGRERLRVYGNAKKYVITEPQSEADGFSALPETLSLPGLDRPIFLRRGFYWDALTSVLGNSGARPERTLVAGDIFELDLALPAALGFPIHLVARPKTPSYERDAVVAHEHGEVSEDLESVVSRLRG